MIFHVACAWVVANMVASGVYRRSYWKARNVPLSQIYHDAKQGRETLPRGDGIERVTGVGSTILTLIFFALYFIFSLVALVG